MHYTVLEVTEDTLTLWDGLTKDPDHPGEPAGLLTLTIRDHDFVKGDKVQIAVRLIQRKEQEQE